MHCSYRLLLGHPIAMSYRGSGQFDRATAGSTSFTSDALGLGSEVTGSTTTHYTRTPDGELLGMRRGGSRYYFLLDGLGSVAAVVDQAGATAATYSYEPFGKLRASTGTLVNPFKWLGSLGVYSDDAVTGLHKMGTRWYDPALGRFTQRDPVPGGALNAYDYAGQDPLNHADPTGEWFRCGGAFWDCKDVVSVVRRVARAVGKSRPRVLVCLPASIFQGGMICGTRRVNAGLVIAACAKNASNFSAVWAVVEAAFKGRFEGGIKRIPKREVLKIGLRAVPGGTLGSCVQGAWFALGERGWG